MSDTDRTYTLFNGRKLTITLTDTAFEDGTALRFDLVEEDFTPVLSDIMSPLELVHMLAMRSANGEARA